MPTMENTVMALTLSMAAEVAPMMAVTAAMGARPAVVTRPATMAMLTVPTHMKHASCAIETS